MALHMNKELRGSPGRWNLLTVSASSASLQGSWDAGRLPLEPSGAATRCQGWVCPRAEKMMAMFAHQTQTLFT